MSHNSDIQEIKDRLDVVTVVGRYVPLKKSGGSYKGLCPFHSEKTPSFHVFPQTGTWKCFGCGAGGDIFTFVEKRENLPFSDVLRMLAKEAGVSLHEARPEVREAHQRLRDLHAQATSWFQSQLLSSKEGARARSYLERRQINQETIEAFQLGYARDGWEHLMSWLKQKGFSPEEIIQSGLAIQRDTGGAYDRFRNRLIIPIRDAQGRVIAFGGRILGEGEPKYLNSPQTPIFDKSRVVFALDMARRAIRAKDQVVLVEGYMDVISAHQRGFKNVVAAMGTSITPQQIKLISRYSQNFVFALDADAAGARATWRGVQLVQETLAVDGELVATSRGIRSEKRTRADLKIAIMPEGQDPDDVLRQNPEQWRTLIENAIVVVDYILQQTAQRFDLTTAAGKSQFVQEILPTLSKIGDPVKRAHYIGEVASKISVKESVIEEALKQFERDQRRRSPSSRPARPPVPTSGPEMPPEEAVVGSSEEPPLWTDEPGGETPAVTQTPGKESAQKRSALVGPEDHVLSLLLFHHQALLPWLDDELAARQLDPLYVEDFSDFINRTLFELLDEFRFEHADGDLASYMADQDTHIHEHFLFLWEYAQKFDAEKPKHIQFHHLQRDVVTNLIRLRLARIRETQQLLEVNMRDAADADEKRTLSLHVRSLLMQRKRLESALSSYSQAARWVSNNRSIYAA